MIDDLQFLKLAIEPRKTLEKRLLCVEKDHFGHAVLVSCYEDACGWEIKVECLRCKKVSGAFIRAIEVDDEFFFVDGFNDEHLMEFLKRIFLNYVPGVSKY